MRNAQRRVNRDSSQAKNRALVSGGLFARAVPSVLCSSRFLRRLLQTQLGGGVFAEEGVVADIAAHGGERLMAGLAHDVELGGVIQIRLRDEAGAQAVPGKACLIEAGALDGAFQNARQQTTDAAACPAAVRNGVQHKVGGSGRSCRRAKLRIPTPEHIL